MGWFFLVKFKISAKRCIIFGLFACITFYAAEVLSTGTYTGVILKLPGSARAAGMGNAFGGIVDDAAAMYWNPAGLAQIYTPQMSIFYGRWIADMNYGAISAVSPLKARRSLFGVIGMNVFYLDQGKIIKTDVNGFITGESVKAGDLCVYFSYAYSVRNIVNLGTNFKIIYSALGERNAVGVGMDLGAFIMLRKACSEKLLSRLNVGVSAKNLISTPLVYGNSKNREYISPEYMFSVGGQVMRNLNTSIDISIFPDYKKPRASLGVEYWVKKLTFLPIALRCGYTYSTYNKFSKILGLTGGVGIIYKNIEIDYSYVPEGRLGATHYVSLTYVKAEFMK